MSTNLQQNFSLENFLQSLFNHE
uniref:Uncharacterized protein n=1 Tax=Rhizophora mucronata TaxID=61149 RepID=A0A2P2Q0I1_RHIMU